jgi:HSP20 family protein
MEKRNPFWNIERTMDEMNRMFDVFQGPLGLRSMPRGTFPAISVFENDDELILQAEVPGVDPRELELTAVEDSITLSGTKNGAHEDVTYYRRERPTGTFTRTLSLSEKIAPDKIKAESKNGILTVHLPKAKQSKPKQISIKAR